MEVSWSWTAPRAVTVKEQAYAVRPEVNLARVAQFQADLLVAAHVQATLASAAVRSISSKDLIGSATR